MDSKELGKRIKEARIAKKMTQSELVGTFITRNMLSRIESGNACPSVKTLEYLANRLELPAGSLIEGIDAVTDDNESTGEKNHEILLEAKRLYINESYDAAAECAEKLTDTEFSDEGCAILAKCDIKRARAAADSGDTKSAAQLAKSAMQYADSGIYRSREVSVDAMLLLEEIAEKSRG